VNYQEATDMLDWLNERFRKARMKPWYRWAIDIDWDKVKKWTKLLGYKEAQDD